MRRLETLPEVFGAVIVEGKLVSFAQRFQILAGPQFVQLCQKIVPVGAELHHGQNSTEVFEEFGVSLVPRQMLEQLFLMPP
jgi:hypothetical protein